MFMANASDKHKNADRHHKSAKTCDRQSECPHIYSREWIARGTEREKERGLGSMFSKLLNNSDIDDAVPPVSANPWRALLPSNKL